MSSIAKITTAVIIKTFTAFLDPVRLNEKEPCTINISSDSQGNLLVKQNFTLNSLSREILDTQLQSDSGKSWDEIAGNRAFNCEVVLDITNGSCSHKVSEASSSTIDPTSHINNQMSAHRLSRV